MKKQILIAIAALIGSGIYLSLNAQDIDDCGSTGRRVFDGARSPSGPREDRPSVKPDRGASDQPRFSGSGGGTSSSVSAPSSKPSRTNTKSTPKERENDGIALLGLGCTIAFGGVFAALVLSQPLLFLLYPFGAFMMFCGSKIRKKASEELRANALRP